MAKRKDKKKSRNKIVRRRSYKMRSKRKKSVKRKSKSVATRRRKSRSKATRRRKSRSKATRKSAATRRRKSKMNSDYFSGIERDFREWEAKERKANEEAERNAKEKAERKARELEARELDDSSFAYYLARRGTVERLENIVNIYLEKLNKLSEEKHGGPGVEGQGFKNILKTPIENLKKFKEDIENLYDKERVGKCYECIDVVNTYLKTLKKDIESVKKESFFFHSPFFPALDPPLSLPAPPPSNVWSHFLNLQPILLPPMEELNNELTTFVVEEMKINNPVKRDD